MKLFILYFALLVCVSGLAFYIWKIGRGINYQFSYESMVTATIKETVKPECLK